MNLSHVRAAVLLIVTVTVTPLLSSGQETGSGSTVEALRLRIEAAADRADDWILSRRALPEFYERRDYEPVWISDAGGLAMLNDLISRIERLRQDGLEPSDYHLGRLRSLASLAQAPSNSPTASLVELELRATDAFLMLASHLVAGRTDPESLRAEWIAVRRDANPIRRLEEAVASRDVGATLDSLVPPYPEYERLKDARARYERIALGGGWPTVPEGSKLELGVTDDRVRVLRARLRATGSSITGGSPVYDAELRDAVVEFQRRHGLDADGVVGPATLAALNVAARDRVRQIEINLERWRWLPQDLGNRYIIVNIANFELDLVEDGQVTMNMRAVVGRTYRRTPVFSDRMTYVVLNPSWNVPASIATADILPKLRTDPTYLAGQNMKLFNGWGADQRELLQSDVDWGQVPAGAFPYHIQQLPGPTNALGRVKFMFPNQFNVYLHDTPSRELFSRTDRTFSSGCIRIERPLDLAAYLLERDRGWTRSQLDSVLARGGEQTVNFTSPIPVHLLYWTAWVDADGRMQFRNDIYDRDSPVRQALDESPARD